MAGFVPDEGETLILQLVNSRVHIDRDADLEMGLFTNVLPTDTITEATITEPVFDNYARITLTDGSWTTVGDQSSYAKQTFTAGATVTTGGIYGYFIATKSSGGTQRILYIEIDSAGIFNFTPGASYSVTPTITVSG